MKEITCKIVDNFGPPVLQPFSPEDLIILREYKPNQVVRVKITGVQKPRSVIQMRLYWATCRVVAENTENKGWNTQDKVDFQCRVNLHFVDKDTVVVKPDGEVVYKYRSIAFKNLSHIMACNYFDNAFQVMAKFLRVPVDKLLSMGSEG